MLHIMNIIINHEVFALLRRHSERRLADHRTDLICTDPSRIDHDFRLIVMILSMDYISLIRPVNRSHFGIQMQLCTVIHGNLRTRNRYLPWIDIRSGRKAQHFRHAVIEIRLFFSRLITAQPFIRNVSALCPISQNLEMSFFLGRSGSNISTIDLILAAKVPAELLIHSCASHVQLCFQGSVSRIISGMNNCRVGHGRFISNVILPVQNRSLQLIAGQVFCQHRASDPCSDNYCIIHKL